MKLLILAVIVVVGGVGCGLIGRQPSAAEPQVATVVVATAPGDRTIEMTEAELTQELNQQIAGQPLGSTPMGPASVQRLTAHLRNGQLLADGDLLVGGATVPVEMTASMHIDNERPLVVVEDLRAAGLPLPASSREPVQNALQAQMDAQVQRLQLRVTSLTMNDGILRLVGSRR